MPKEKMSKTPKKCPNCDGELSERKVHITYENGKTMDDMVYVCNKNSCGGVFLPQSIFGVGP